MNYASEALWIDVLNASYAGFTDSYTMLNATIGVKLAAGKVIVEPEGHRTSRTRRSSSTSSATS